MKKTILNLFTVTLIISIFISCSQKPEFKGKFSFYPENPKPGDEITVRYVADSTNLADKQSIDLAAYFYDNDLIDAVSAELEKKPDGWYGKMTAPDDAYGVIIKFVSDETIDNNKSKGYLINLYDGDEMISGSKAGYATAGIRWGINSLDLKMEGSEANQLFEEDLKNHPELKAEFISPYLGSLLRTFPEKTDSILNAELALLEGKEKLTENELQYLASRYKTPPYVDSVKADKYFQMLAKEYPQNELVQSHEYEKVYKEQDFAKKMEMINVFEEKFPKFESLSYLYFMAGRKYIEEKNIDSIIAFGKKYQFKVHPAFFTRSINNLIEEEGIDLNKLLSLSALGVEASREQIKNNFILKQKFETNKEYERSNDYFLAINLNANAKVLEKLEKYEQAMPLLEEAVNKAEESDPAINNFFVGTLFKLKNYDKLTSVVENLISEGKATSEMKDLLKEVYIIKNGNDAGFASYISKFEGEAKVALLEKLKNEMISEPAPDFTLSDLKGKKVSLASLKGKTVIVDFWATWCGPCISSFPAMQQAVNSFKDNPNVQFLFINTWERVEDKVRNAADFISKNNYTFHVLVDEENKVIDSYKVSGIPTKFIIDKEGKIRFKSVGFSGNNDELIEELGAMIEMLK